MAELTKINQIKFLREGGDVKRCHTFPHHGEYTVGKHSFDALNLLLILHPNPSINLIKAIQWHDVPERFTGDIPATVKWQNPILTRQLELMEENTLIQFGLNGPFEEIDSYDKIWLHAIDKLELWIWAKDQITMGNLHAHDMVSRLNGWFDDNEIPEPVEEVIATYIANRLGDNIYEAS